MLQRSALRHLLVFCSILLIHILAFVLIKDHGMIMDEHLHYEQIVQFLHGDFHLEPELPMSPGYHLTMAGIAYPLGLAVVPYYSAIAMMRFLSWLLAIASIVMFFLCARSIDKKSALMKTVTYALFPIFVPFFSLLYTDLLSVGLVLSGLFFLLKKQYLFSSIFCALSIGVRQNNIVWGACFFVIAYVQSFGYRIAIEDLRQHLMKSFSFLLCPVVFLFLIWWFGGVSSGTQTHVWVTVVVPQNLYLFLFLFFFFFLPLIIHKGKQIGKRATQIGWYWIVVPVLFLGFHFTFSIQHPFNRGSFFVHNAILEYFTGHWVRNVGFFTVMTVSTLYLSVTRLSHPALYLLYPFIILFFIPLWFIEARYTMIPIALFLLFRKPEERRAGYILIGWSLLLSALMYWGMHQWKFLW